MKTTIHHATAKKAEQNNIHLEINEKLRAWTAAHTSDYDKVLAKGDDPKEVLEQALLALNGKPGIWGDRDDATDEDDEPMNEDGDDAAEIEAMEAEADEEAEGKSVVKRKYKKQYRPFKNRCGDNWAERITDNVAERDDDGKVVTPVRIDPERLEQFARANEVWKEEYNHLNIGMRRMNIGNRIRGKVKKGDEPVFI